MCHLKAPEIIKGTGMHCINADAGCINFLNEHCIKTSLKHIRKNIISKVLVPQFGTLAMTRSIQTKATAVEKYTISAVHDIGYYQQL
jgi:hypothetical protein